MAKMICECLCGRDFLASQSIEKVKENGVDGVFYLRYT